MPKRIKLKEKPPEPKPQKETRFFFVKDQGSGAVRVMIIIFKLLELFLTSVFAVCLGVIAPLLLFLGEEADTSYTLPAVFWLSSSVLYIVGMFTLIFAKTKAAAVIHGAAAVCTICTYGAFRAALKEFPELSPPAWLFMPCLLITALTVGCLLMLYVPEWTKRYIEKRDEKAPSILGDSDDD